MRKSLLIGFFLAHFGMLSLLFGGNRERLLVQATGEGGAFLTENYADKSLMRLIGNLRYDKTYTQTYFQLKIRLAPEVYGADRSQYAVKTKSIFTLGGQNKSAFAWRFDLNYRFYYYDLGQNANIRYNIFYLAAQGSWPRKTGAAWLAQLGYFYRDISGQPFMRLDSYNAQGGIGGRFRDKLNYQLKLYVERFLIHESIPYSERGRNSGTRVGPLLAVRYAQDYIFNAAYLLVLEQNRLNRKTVVEHSVRLVAGKYLSDRLSLFVYIKYFIRNAGNEVVEDHLTYTPLDSENWLYAKAGYDVGKNSELFLRFGYLNDTLPGRKEELSGWQILAGFHHIFRKQ
ncbi:MAG TPA: hypothetical protein ENK44_09715 [Caldithrix abyssi]|uniref:Porin n=1 Tax=Caldithrix abyssi TaxID=187145 RepID=A0A7V4WVK3_CALAY|nr:hypothetical protein [Caldithrix abyssi]